jgi:uncharacterized iron-regulated membrane protein
MTFKQAIGKLHLWLGLASGLVVFVVSLTGAIFTFQDEIRDLTEPWRKVEAPTAAPLLRPSRLQAAALARHPGVDKNTTWVTYFGPARSATVFFTDPAGAPTQVYLNPYTGQVLHEQDLRRHFFSIVQEIHMTLLLPEAVAKWVVGGSVIIFLLMLGTGLVAQAQAGTAAALHHQVGRPLAAYQLRPAQRAGLLRGRHCGAASPHGLVHDVPLAARYGRADG